MIEKLVAEATECDFNRSFDAIITDARKEDYSFTLLEATYLEKTGNHFASSDYISFGLADKDGFLTNAGKLMADQYIVRNSRVFCTQQLQGSLREGSSVACGQTRLCRSGGYRGSCERIDTS